MYTYVQQLGREGTEKGYNKKTEGRRRGWHRQEKEKEKASKQARDKEINK